MWQVWDEAVLPLARVKQRVKPYKLLFNKHFFKLLKYVAKIYI